jgi:hypothetical protein
VRRIGKERKSLLCKPDMAALAMPSIGPQKAPRDLMQERAEAYATELRERFDGQGDDGRVLVRNGHWAVPVAARPAGWQKWEIPE